MTHSDFFDSSRLSPTNHTAECMETWRAVGRPVRTAQLFYALGHETTEFSVFRIIIKHKFLQHGCTGETPACVVTSGEQMLSSERERLESRLNCRDSFFSTQAAGDGRSIIQARAGSKTYFGSMAEHAGKKLKIINQRESFVPQPALPKQGARNKPQGALHHAATYKPGFPPVGRIHVLPYRLHLELKSGKVVPIKASPFAQSDGGCATGNHYHLQLDGARPQQIVGIEELDVITRAFLKCNCRSALASVFLMNDLDAMVSVGLQNLATSICRTVIDRDDFFIRPRLGESRSSAAAMYGAAL